MRRIAAGKVKHVSQVDKMYFCPQCAKYCTGATCPKCGSTLIEVVGGKPTDK